MFDHLAGSLAAIAAQLSHGSFKRLKCQYGEATGPMQAVSPMHMKQCKTSKSCLIAYSTLVYTIIPIPSAHLQVKNQTIKENK